MSSKETKSAALHRFPPDSKRRDRGETYGFTPAVVLF